MISRDQPPESEGTVSFRVDEQFDQVVEDLLPRQAVPSPAWLDQARRNAQLRAEYLADHGALTSAQVAWLAGSDADNQRQTAWRWERESRKIFSVQWQGSRVYPGFQFDPQDGRPLPQVAQVLKALPDQLRGWELALWWTSPVHDPHGQQWTTPLDVLDESAVLVRLARATASDWRAAGAS